MMEHATHSVLPLRFAAPTARTVDSGRVSLENEFRSNRFRLLAGASAERQPPGKSKAYTSH